MCGICGIKLPTPGPIGRNLVDMCQAMRHRGYDSTGFALYGEAVEGQLILRLRIVDASQTHPALSALEGSLRERGVSVAAEHETDNARAIDDAGHDIQVQSIGRSLEIIKDLGDAETVNARHGIDTFIGSHGLGHVRL